MEEFTENLEEFQILAKPFYKTILNLKVLIFDYIKDYLERKTVNFPLHIEYYKYFSKYKVDNIYHFIVPHPNFLYQIVDTAYKWKENGIFVNFAAKELGGGVLKLGWAQEEFLSASLSLLPFIEELRKLDDYFKNLDINPILFSTKAYFSPNNKYFGWKKLQDNSEEIKEKKGNVFFF